MKTRQWRFAPALSALVVALTMVPSALAMCSLPTKPIKPMDWRPQHGAAHLSLARIALDADDDRSEPSIIGMWHVIFTAQTQNGEPVPVKGGAVIDNAVVVWHSDGTEIMDFARAAQDGTICLGVWTRTGKYSYLP